MKWCNHFTYENDRLPERDAPWLSTAAYELI